MKMYQRDLFSLPLETMEKTTWYICPGWIQCGTQMLRFLLRTSYPLKNHTSIYPVFWEVTVTLV